MIFFFCSFKRIFFSSLEATHMLPEDLKLAFHLFALKLHISRKKVAYFGHVHLTIFQNAQLLSHALFLKVFKSWVYPSKKKMWCASKFFFKIENMGTKECKNVKILKKNPWHQLSTWGSLSWSQSIKINVISVFYW